MLLVIVVRVNVVTLVIASWKNAVGEGRYTLV